MEDRLTTSIRTDVEHLCALGDRDLGSERNLAATDYVIRRFAQIGLESETLGFAVPEWRAGDAIVRAEGFELAACPGPYSPAVAGEGPLVVIRTPQDIASVSEPAAVLLLVDEIAKTQFTPRDYPFYGDAAHASILDALEAANPLAVLAATDKSPMTGAMSPFPLVEDVSFAVPSGYMTVEQGAKLKELAGDVVAVSIESEVLPSRGKQPVGRRAGHSDGRVIVCAHIDTKPGTPGAVDNAAGVATMLAVADLLGRSEARRTLEFVPFNGEDHVLAPGELAWLGTNSDLSDVVLAINIDAAGLSGAPSAYSLYGVDESLSAVAASIASSGERVVEGPQWPASDHMIFAMRGIPAIAVTSADLARISDDYSHTPADTPDILDYSLLADTARFVAEVVAAA